MGDMADDAYIQVERELAELECVLLDSDEQLIQRTVKARLPIVKSIRAYYFERKTMSHKQRYVLAMWILAHGL